MSDVSIFWWGEAVKRIAVLLVAFSLFSSVMLLPACARSDSSFGIYLADSGKQVLSLTDIKAYHSLNHALELNESGMEKWNSYQTSTTVPHLAENLFGKEFILKIEGREVCRGEFYSGVSSASYNGVVIMDSLFKLEGERNFITFDFGYVESIPSSEENRITSELEGFFSGRHLLVADEGWGFSP